MELYKISVAHSKYFKTFNYILSAALILGIIILFFSSTNILESINPGENEGKNNSFTNSSAEGTGTYYSTQDDSDSPNDGVETSENESKNSELAKSTYKNVVENDFKEVKLLRSDKPEASESNILEVRADQSPVAGAEISINGNLEGETTREGLFFFSTPSSETMNISIRKDQRKALVNYELE